MIYGAGFVQVFVIPSEPVVESNLPVWSSCWNYGFGDLQGSIALCRNNIAEPMPFGTKTQKDYIQMIHGRKIDTITVYIQMIHGRKIDTITVQFVSWSQYMVRTFLTGGTCGFSSVLKWLAVPLPLHSPQQCMFFLSFFFACLLLLPSPEAHIKWLLHVVSQEAAKSRVENVRGFARDLHAFGLFFWFNSEKAWAKYCLAPHLWTKGPIGEVSGKLVGRKFPHWKQL